MCNCISEVEEQLKASGKNTMLDIPITFSFTGSLSGGKVTISTCKRDEKKREKPLRLFASFCPFCGEAYPSKQAAEQSVQRTCFYCDEDKEPAKETICQDCVDLLSDASR